MKQILEQAFDMGRCFNQELNGKGSLMKSEQMRSWL